MKIAEREAAASGPARHLYAHFPFCRSKCAYCALFSEAGSGEALRRGYANAVARRLALLPVAPDTVYFGGGTPAISFPEVACAPLANSAVREFSIELNPADVVPGRASSLLEAGFNRASLGVQSFNERTLSAMGRVHSARDAENAFRILRKEGFGNAGVDLIAGWPGETPEEWRETAERAVALAPDHISAYSLIRERGTRLDAELSAAGAALDDSAALDRIAEAAGIFGRAGYVRYEVSNWCRPGRECAYNLAVWRGEDYAGIGAGASSREGLRRRMVARSAEAFASGGDDAFDEDETVSPLDDAVSREIFRLRLAEGLNVDEAAARRPVLLQIAGEWKRELDEAVRLGLLGKSPGGAYCATPRGFEVLDSILASLVP